MKKVFTLLAMLTLFAGVSLAQVDATTSETDGAQMEFETMVMDYGEIEQNSDPLRKFNFKNTGNQPLVISHAKGSCGCTVPVWPKEPIMPGEEANIEVRYDTKRIGKFVKKVTLTTNALNSEDGKIVLTIKGKVNKKAPEPEGVPASSPSILGGSN